MSEVKVEWMDSSAEEKRIHALWDKHVGHVWKPVTSLPRIDAANLFAAIYNMTREALREGKKGMTRRDRMVITLSAVATGGIGAFYCRTKEDADRLRRIEAEVRESLPEVKGRVVYIVPDEEDSEGVPYRAFFFDEEA